MGVMGSTKFSLSMRSELSRDILAIGIIEICLRIGLSSFCLSVVDLILSVMLGTTAAGDSSVAKFAALHVCIGLCACYFSMRLFLSLLTSGIYAFSW